MLPTLARGFSHALQTRSNTHEKTSLDLANYVKSMPSAFWVRPGSIPVGTIVEARRHGPRVLSRRLLSYFCELILHVILLVFLLVSAAIDG
jgi:hypothetical protein